MSLAVNQYVPGGAVPQSFRLQNNTQSAILTGGWMPYGSMAWANDDSNMIVRDYAGVFHIFKPYTAFYLKHSLVDSAALAYTAVRADSSGKTGQIYWDSISARTEYLTGSMGIGNVQPIPTRKLSVSTGGVEGVAKFLQSQDAGTVLPAVEVVSAGKSALDVAQWMNSNGYWIQRWYDNASRTFGDTASISGGVQIFAAGIRADGKMFLGDSSRLTANLTVSKGLRIRDSLTADSANIRAIRAKKIFIDSTIYLGLSTDNVNLKDSSGFMVLNSGTISWRMQNGQLWGGYIYLTGLIESNIYTGNTTRATFDGKLATIDTFGTGANPNIYVKAPLVVKNQVSVPTVKADTIDSISGQFNIVSKEPFTIFTALPFWDLIKPAIAGFWRVAYGGLYDHSGNLYISNNISSGGVHAIEIDSTTQAVITDTIATRAISINGNITLPHNLTAASLTISRIQTISFSGGFTYTPTADTSILSLTPTAGSQTVTLGSGGNAGQKLTIINVSTSTACTINCNGTAGPYVLAPASAMEFIQVGTTWYKIT
jgi:hypothetical protein